MINLLAVVLVVIGTITGAIGALILKKGSEKSSLRYFWKDRYLFGGFFFYGMSTVLYIIALRLEHLSVLYPLVSTSYIWTTLFSVKFLHEKMNQWKWIALSGIILGVTFIGFGS